MTHSSWPRCSKVKYEKRSSSFHPKNALTRRQPGPETHTLPAAARTWVEMSSYRRQNMSSPIEIQNKHRLPVPLIKSGTSEKWVLCVGNKTTPVTRPTQREDGEDTLAVRQQRAVAREATPGDR